MWPFHPELLAKPVPRYTSYPTAAEFREDFVGGDMSDAIETVASDTLFSVYVHIPFCREICWYCGCNTARVGRSQRLLDYLEHLHREVDLLADQLAGRGCVGRIAFGGGSPNAIPASAFAGLVRHIQRRLDAQDASLSIEIDPRTFDAEWAAMLAELDVERASIGVQTLDPLLQAAIGRVQPSDQIASAIDGLRKAGVTSLNVDLLYGLPGQGREALVDSLETSLAFGADRMAVFGYAHVPHLVPRQRRIDAGLLPATEERFVQAWTAFDWLTSAGMIPVGFDHFARIGDPLAEAVSKRRLHRNFQGFTDDPADILIGLGASAISSFPQVLLQNDKHFGRYQRSIDARRFAIARGVERSADDQHRARLIESLLCVGEADLSGLDDLAAIQRALVGFERLGLIVWRDRLLTLSHDALPYARTIAAALDRHRTETAMRFSTAV